MFDGPSPVELFGCSVPVHIVSAASARTFGGCRTVQHADMEIMPTRIFHVLLERKSFVTMQMSNTELQQAKAAMDTSFQQNAIHPGDAEYVYDVQKDFQPAPHLPNEWDESSDESSCLN